jgi:hypothetical protein
MPKKPPIKPPTPKLALVPTNSPTAPPRVGYRALTSRQESFCVDIAAGMEPAAAFKKHYTWNGNPGRLGAEAGKVINLPHVGARLAELRAAYATKVVESSRGMPAAEAAPAYGVKQAMAELDQGMTLAVLKENPAAVAKIVEVRMKLYGLGVADMTNPEDKQPLTPEQLELALAEIRAHKEARRAT